MYQSTHILTQKEVVNKEKKIFYWKTGNLEPEWINNMKQKSPTKAIEMAPDLKWIYCIICRHSISVKKSNSRWTKSLMYPILLNKQTNKTPQSLKYHKTLTTIHNERVSGYKPCCANTDVSWSEYGRVYKSCQSSEWVASHLLY